MLQAAQLLTIIFIISSVMEKDTGRVLSMHMKFNEKLMGWTAFSWVIYWFFDLM